VVGAAAPARRRYGAVRSSIQSGGSGRSPSRTAAAGDKDVGHRWDGRAPGDREGGGFFPSVCEKQAVTPAGHLHEGVTVRGRVFRHNENIADLQGAMTVMRAARRTETVVMFTISVNGELVDSKGLDP